jgi:hypothetical protein
MIVNYDRNRSFIILAKVITIINYDCKTFIVQASGSVCLNSGILISRLVGFDTLTKIFNSAWAGITFPLFSIALPLSYSDSPY